MGYNCLHKSFEVSLNDLYAAYVAYIKGGSQVTYRRLSGNLSELSQVNITSCQKLKKVTRVTKKLKKLKKAKKS